MTAKLPAMRIRILNFVQALTGHVSNGMRTVSTEEATRRLEICETNECGHFTGTHCGQCGCPAGGDEKFLNKVAWESEKCPVGKW